MSEPPLHVRLVVFLLGLGLLTHEAHSRSPGPLLDEVIGLAHADRSWERGPQACTHTQALADGGQLAENADLYKIWHPERAYGRPGLVELLVQTGKYLAFHAPEADPPVVGDMSAPRGGPLYGHRSHRGGIDADVGIYWGEGQQHVHGFMDVRPSELDVEATWLEIQGMLLTGLVERIFLDQALIDRLRAFTVQSGELSPEEAARVFPSLADPGIWKRTGVVQHLPEHRNHLHVRVLCSGR